MPEGGLKLNAHWKQLILEFMAEMRDPESWIFKQTAADERRRGALSFGGEDRHWSSDEVKALPEDTDAKCGCRKSVADAKTPPGSIRRLVADLMQLDLTYDLHGMSERDLLALLPPREFGPWIPAGEKP